MNSNEEIILSSLCDRIMAFCNRLNKRLDVIDEREQPGYQHYSHHQPLTAAYGQPPYASFDSGVNNTGWPPPPTAPEPEMQPEPYHIYPLPPPAQMPEPYHHYPSLTQEPDDPYYHYQPSEELYPPVYNGEGYSSNSFNYSVDDYLLYTDSWQPGPSCWDPPTPAFEQPPYTYTDSYAPLRIPYAGDHREQSNYQPTRLQYTGPDSHWHPHQHQHQLSVLDQQTAAAVPQPPQPRQPSCGPPTSPRHSATAPLPAAAAVQPPPVAISPLCSADISTTLVPEIVEQSTPSTEEVVSGEVLVSPKLNVIVIGYVTEVVNHCRCSFLGVCENVISDLIDPTRRELAKKDDVKKGFYGENMMVNCVACYANLTPILVKSQSNRQIGATYIHSKSSRSHIMFTSIIESWWRFGKQGLIHGQQRPCTFDPGGGVSPKRLLTDSLRCFVIPTLRTRWISTVGELIRDISISLLIYLSIIFHIFPYILRLFS